jgi:hypothetical protein
LALWLKGVEKVEVDSDSTDEDITFIVRSSETKKEENQLPTFNLISSMKSLENQTPGILWKN